MDSRDIERIALSVMELHGCHTMILYGSRARGDATPQSDLDIMCIREVGPTLRDARVVEGLYVDGFVYPESAFTTLEPALLRVLGGVVIRERDGFGTALLTRIREFGDRGPVPLPDDERQALKVWSQKMLDRFRGDRGVEASYRRMSLVVQALDDYFSLRNTWTMGPKHGFAWLLQHDASTHAVFERAAQPGASDGDFAALVQAVYRPDEGVSG
jgi:predicted nucleotidyltransferase